MENEMESAIYIYVRRSVHVAMRLPRVRKEYRNGKEIETTTVKGDKKGPCKYRYIYIYNV